MTTPSPVGAQPQKPVPLLIAEDKRALLLDRFELIFELTHGDQLLTPFEFARDQAIIRIDGVILPAGKRRLVTRSRRRTRPTASSSSATTPHSPAEPYSLLFSRRCARSNGWSTQRSRLAGRRPCSPTCCRHDTRGRRSPIRQPAAGGRLSRSCNDPTTAETWSDPGIPRAGRGEVRGTIIQAAGSA